MNTALIISYTILIIVVNIVSARLLAEWLKPRVNLFDVWFPRISLVPPLGIIGLLLSFLVMFITIVLRTIKDIWE